MYARTPILRCGTCGCRSTCSRKRMSRSRGRQAQYCFPDIDARPSSRLRHIDVHYSHEKNFLINQAWLTTHQNNDFKKSTLRLTIHRARNVIQFCSNNVQTISIRNTSASKQGMMNHWKMLTHRMMMPFATFVSSTDS